jgi:hypothetical protein
MARRLASPRLIERGTDEGAPRVLGRAGRLFAGQNLRKNLLQRFLAQFIIGVTSGRLHGRLKVEMLETRYRQPAEQCHRSWHRTPFFKWALRRSVA